MKRITLLLICTALLFSTDLFSQSKLRIGTYDSRLIAVWYFNSPDFQKEAKDLREEYKVAKEKGDSLLMKKLQEKGQLGQRIAHDKGFGRGSVAEIIEKKADVLEALAKAENLSAIVSKWELNYSGSDVEVVDITLKLMEALNVPEHLLKMYDEMKKVEPIKDAFFIED